jgi:hypothetical protein
MLVILCPWPFGDSARSARGDEVDEHLADLREEATAKYAHPHKKVFIALFG